MNERLSIFAPLIHIINLKFRSGQHKMYISLQKPRLYHRIAAIIERAMVVVAVKVDEMPQYTDDYSVPFVRMGIVFLPIVTHHRHVPF